MRIIPVSNLSSARSFLEVHVDLNCQNPNFIRPLDQDVEKVFDKNANKNFRHGECQRWLLADGEGKFIGRIAAFVNKKYRNKGDEQPTGGMGFFDCINDQEAANLLFDTAKDWLAARGMEAMDGPINFGERDKFWGLLVEGFQPPPYGMNYNPPYYQQLFENYGFEPFYYQICWSLPVSSEHAQLQRKFYDAHDLHSANPALSVQMVKRNNLDKYAIDFAKVYNQAWAKHEGNKEMNEQQAIKLFRSMKPIMDESLAWFTYHNDEPVAMWINIPDLNQIFRHFNGKMNLWNKLRFLYYHNKGECDRFIGIIYGIIPAFQGTGVDYYMIVEAEKVIKQRGRYKELELLWQGDFNIKMLNISRNLGATESRRLATFRYLFDRSRPFKRHPFID